MCKYTLMFLTDLQNKPKHKVHTPHTTAKLHTHKKRASFFPSLARILTALAVCGALR